MNERTYILILAAGQSMRYGRTKLLDEFNGRPLLQHSLAACQEACPRHVYLVTGHDAEDITHASAGLADKIVLNNKYESGIGSSIARGVSDLPEDAGAVVIVLADQPLVTAAHLAGIIHRWDGDPDAIVATRFADIDGPPVLFGQRFFGQLLELEGDAGAKRVLRAHPDAVQSVEFENAAIDVDTPGDLEALPDQSLVS